MRRSQNSHCADRCLKRGYGGVHEQPARRALQPRGDRTPPPPARAAHAVLIRSAQKDAQRGPIHTRAWTCVNKCEKIARFIDRHARAPAASTCLFLLSILRQCAPTKDIRRLCPPHVVHPHESRPRRRENTNRKYTCDTGQTRDVSTTRTPGVVNKQHIVHTEVPTESKCLGDLFERARAVAGGMHHMARESEQWRAS